MLQLAKALTERPQLKVDIQGYADPEADAEKIRLDRFDAKLKAASKDSKISERARMAMVFVATNGEAALTALHDEFTPKPEPEKAPNADITQPNASQEKNKTAPVPDEAALYKAMRERLLATENITKADLKTLAINRAQTVMDVLVAKGKVEGERVFVLNGEVGDPGAGLRTKMILGAK